MDVNVGDNARGERFVYDGVRWWLNEWRSRDGYEFSATD
jgi:hypothetical protein